MKTQIGLYGLVRTKLFLKYFLLLPLVFIVGQSMLGVLLSKWGFFVSNFFRDGLLSPVMLIIFICNYGYSILIPLLMSSKIPMYLSKLEFKRSDYVVLTFLIGVIFFISMEIGTFMGLNVLEILIPEFDLSIIQFKMMYMYVSFFSGAPFSAWLLGGFLLTYRVIDKFMFEKVTKVTFNQAVGLLDSEIYYSGSRMNLAFEAIVQSEVSTENRVNSASYREIFASNHNGTITRKLIIWGENGLRYNLEIASNLSPGDRILVIFPTKPKGSEYQKDQHGQNVFWVLPWDGNLISKGTRLYKIGSGELITTSDIPPMEVVKNQSEITENTVSSTESSSPFYCQICAVKHPTGTLRLQCEKCGRFVCLEAFKDMISVGRTGCPMCDGTLS